MSFFHPSLPPSRMRRAQRQPRRTRILTPKARRIAAKATPTAMKQRNRSWGTSMKTQLARLRIGARKTGGFLRYYAPLFWFSLLLAVFGYMLATRT
jgi:hypothetical protein